MPHSLLALEFTDTVTNDCRVHDGRLHIAAAHRVPPPWCPRQRQPAACLVTSAVVSPDVGAEPQMAWNCTARTVEGERGARPGRHPFALRRAGRRPLGDDIAARGKRWPQDHTGRCLVTHFSLSHQPGHGGALAAPHAVCVCVSTPSKSTLTQGRCHLPGTVQARLQR